MILDDIIQAKVLQCRQLVEEFNVHHTGVQCLQRGWQRLQKEQRRQFSDTCMTCMSPCATYRRTQTRQPHCQVCHAYLPCHTARMHTCNLIANHKAHHQSVKVPEQQVFGVIVL
jgi:hypothetical protein